MSQLSETERLDMIERLNEVEQSIVEAAVAMATAPDERKGKLGVLYLRTMDIAVAELITLRKKLEIPNKVDHEEMWQLVSL